ncbi:MAG: DUF2262 domain-containing protein, partial [Bacteroidota bacterium]
MLEKIKRFLGLVPPTLPSIVSGSFGTIEYSPDFDSYTTNASWLGEEIELEFWFDDNRTIEEALITAERLWERQSDWQRKIEAFIIAELIGLKNEAWLEENEPPVGAPLFLSRIRLEVVSVGEEGGFCFWYDDGELFWGHSILVSGTLTDGITDAEIAR